MELGDIPGTGLVVGGVMITLIGALAAGFLGYGLSGRRIFAKPHAGGPHDLWRHKQILKPSFQPSPMRFVR